MRISGNSQARWPLRPPRFLLRRRTSAEAAKLEGRNVKIGCLAPLTGKGAEWGQAAKISMEIAVEEINAKGGIGGIADRADLLRHADARSRGAQGGQPPGRARQGAGDFRALLQRRVRDDRAAARPRFKTVINSYCSAKPGLSAMSNWAFRNTLTSDKQLKPVVAAWLEEYKMKKVVIIYDAEDAVSKGEGAGVLPALFKAAQHRGAGHADLPHQGHRLLGAGDQGEVARRRGIGLGSCYQNAGAIAKEMQKQGLNVPIVGGACAGAPGFIEIAGKAAEGAYMSTAAWLDDPRPEVQAYVKKIVAKNERPAAALQRSARLRHHLFVQALHREVGRHQQAGRSRRGPRQDPRAASAA